MAEKPKPEVKVSEPKKDPTSGSFLKKSWHNIPVFVIALVGLLLIGGALAVVVRTDDNTVNETSDEADLYSEEEREAIEEAQLPEDVETTAQLQSEGKVEESYAIWEERIANSDDPTEKANATFELGLAQANAGNLSAATQTFISIDPIESGLDLFLLYSTTGRIAAQAGDGVNAVKYIELTIQNIKPEAFDYDWEYEQYVVDYNQLLSEVKAL